MISAARHRFRSLMRRPDDQIDLAEAALCIAWEDQGDGDPDAALRAIDTLANEARAHIEAHTAPREIIGALNRFLFDDLGFRGNHWNYSDPTNSFLDRVLAHRVGLPILLSLLYLEIGWRLKLPLNGLALPGHFLVRYANLAGDDLYIDPFNRGRYWTLTECYTQIVAFSGNLTPEVMRQMMAPPSRRAILVRILRNLKSAYLQREQFERALAAVERILIIEIEATEIRDRGLLRARLGQIAGALADFEQYAQLAPRADDLATIRKQARALAEMLAPRN